MANGLQFDITNDEQFRYFVVQEFAALKEQTKGLPEIKVDVPVLKREVIEIREDINRDKFWNNLKLASGPFLVLLHAGARKLGWNI
jgi:hypothetical protein